VGGGGASLTPPRRLSQDVYGGAWNCTVQDCVKGCYWAQLLGWLDFETFNLHEYFFYERIENGHTPPFPAPCSSKQP
jgi:hypothetical protein